MAGVGDSVGHGACTSQQQLSLWAQQEHRAPSSRTSGRRGVDHGLGPLSQKHQHVLILECHVYLLPRMQALGALEACHPCCWPALQDSAWNAQGEHLLDQEFCNQKKQRLLLSSEEN